MARPRLLSAFLSILLLALAAASSDHNAAAKPGVQVPIVANYVSNLTETALFHPPGWYAPNICSGSFCVYSNREIGSGRGLTLITGVNHYHKIARLEKIMKADASKFQPDPPVLGESEGEDKELVATSPIKRGSKLLQAVPVMLVHRTFFNETTPELQTRLLDAAFRLLPQSTQDLLTTQMSKHPKSRLGLKEALHSHPFEVNTGSSHWDGADHGKHLAIYPELFTIRHDCRPNTAYWVDNQHTVYFTAARRIYPGEGLSISYLNPRQSRAQRSLQAQSLWGSPCTCTTCTARGDLSALAAADSRYEEILAIEEQLKDMESTRVTTGMLKRYLELVEQDGLHARLAEAYELVAYNYNYLGYDKRAKKYGSLAVQAGIVEQGPDSNDVVAMRVFTNSPTEHYSFQRKLRRGKAAIGG